MTDYHLKLSWPPKAVHSNSRAPDWRKRKDAAAYRKEGWALALEAKIPKWPNAILECTYHPPSNKFDCQNIPSALKAVIDGIADGMHVDDRHFAVRYPDRFAEVMKPGAILITVKEHDQ